ncbi:MAG: AF1514 family protein [Thermodesulfobacteriota bacterium]
MHDVRIAIDGVAVDFETARGVAVAVAGRHGDEEPMLIAWSDRARGRHSPSCVKCELQGAPGWEVYGRNHGGRLRISVNEDAYVFIYG